MKRRGIRLTLVNGLEASLLPVVKGVAELDLRDRARTEVADGTSSSGGGSSVSGCSTGSGEGSSGTSGNSNSNLTLIIRAYFVRKPTIERCFEVLTAH